MKRVDKAQSPSPVQKKAKSTADPSHAFMKMLEAKGKMKWAKFQSEYFEKQPLVLRQLSEEEFCSPECFSKEELLKIISTENLVYEDHMRVVKYTNSERETLTHDDAEVAKSSQVSEYFNSGYSVQFYQPQRYNDKLFTLLSAFENQFGVLAGSSAYLTPAKTQALAPHHDDVEVFILQTEGKKHWKVYEPIVQLPGEHSGDLDRDALGKLVLDITLESGDMLYLPRGYVHEAIADDETFSTHVTVSIYQFNSWANFLEVALPKLLRDAYDTDVAFREGLPVNYLSYMGSQHLHQGDELKLLCAEKFTKKCRVLLEKLIKQMNSKTLHDAADEASLDFISNRLPPPSALEVESTGERFRIRDPNYIRVIIEPAQDMVVKLCHSFRNSRCDHMGNKGSKESDVMSGDEEEHYEPEDEDSPMAGSLALPYQYLPAILRLISSYPSYTTVEELESSTNVETSRIQGLLTALSTEELLE